MKKQIEMLWGYNYWANRRILAQAETLTAAQVSEKAPYMWDSILRTMAHVLGAEWIWRQRLREGLSPTTELERDQFSTLNLLIQRWAEEEALMLDYLAGLSDANLDSVIDYRSLSGRAQSLPLWQILTHVVNHGTQHRSEVALSLTNFDRSPGDMDMPIYFAQHNR